MRRIIGFIFHKNFEKSFSKLSADVKRAFVERKNLLQIDPDHPLLNDHALHGTWNDFRSINVSGDVRAIYRMEGFIAVFREIGTHSQLYK